MDELDLYLYAFSRKSSFEKVFVCYPRGLQLFAAIFHQLYQRWGTCAPRAKWAFDMAVIRIFIRKLEHKIGSKQSSMISKYLD